MGFRRLISDRTRTGLLTDDEVVSAPRTDPGSPVLGPIDLHTLTQRRRARRRVSTPRLDPRPRPRRSIGRSRDRFVAEKTVREGNVRGRRSARDGRRVVRDEGDVVRHARRVRVEERTGDVLRSRSERGDGVRGVLGVRDVRGRVRRGVSGDVRWRDVERGNDVRR